MDIDSPEVDPIDQPRVKRRKYTDASIHKRAPFPLTVAEASRHLASNRPDEESGPCIYLNRHSVVSYVAERVEKELENGENSKNGVTVRAMGAAIEKAVRLAAELQRRNYSMGILTGTAEVVDDVIYDDNDMELDSQTRRQSTIELRVKRS